MELKTDETGNAIVPVLACVLNQLCLRNDRLPPNQKGVSKFHALRPPAISIKDYLTRISKYACCSGECFVLALVYIDRIIQSNPTFVVNSLNIHRLLITSVMLAAKFFDDQYFNNAYYAKVGGVPCGEMNLLEVEFLFMTNFTLFVTTETYRQYYTELCNHARNTQCGCSTQKVPILHIPADKFAELTYRFDDDEELEDASFAADAAAAASNGTAPAQSPVGGQSGSTGGTAGGGGGGGGVEAMVMDSPVPVSRQLARSPPAHAQVGSSAAAAAGPSAPTDKKAPLQLVAQQQAGHLAMVGPGYQHQSHQQGQGQAHGQFQYGQQQAPPGWQALPHGHVVTSRGVAIPGKSAGGAGAGGSGSAPMITGSPPVGVHS